MTPPSEEDLERIEQSKGGKLVYPYEYLFRGFTMSFALLMRSQCSCSNLNLRRLRILLLGSRVILNAYDPYEEEKNSDSNE